MKTQDKDCCYKKSYNSEKENETHKEENLLDTPGNSKTEKEVKEKPKKNLSLGSSTITVVLTILVLLSLSQTVQTVSLFKAVQKDNFAIQGDNSIDANTAITTGSSSALPDMVGGC
ncbi:MAG: hypothetical protein COU28_00230 [Candidatus Magasanikbacteria bacterium CG10_big_fil_rev_8_21_14_0_10_36_16]|uniref:Uncharacterized protein n=1 Tax=Candidatus Magasanikbacteria bacterium CG10_big_fil_rev_8_21_14_0_10_36_16 TaxID=1974645 RepID=A0A2H0U1Y1_9BACT|nr:MAG: hypothetical protein COU28_00230 [Candidatus Magasanikbacteria bacterium CG10_big_fil_rev_8_21_14_0_10_36_16]